MDIFNPIPLVYPAQSKLHFYCRDAVCEFVLRNDAVPLHPFRLFDYFLGDRVDRNTIRRANNSLVARADELWVFGNEIADGVLVEISHAHNSHKPVRFYTIATRANEITELPIEEISFEKELLEKANENVRGLRDVLKGNLDFQEVFSNID